MITDTTLLRTCRSEAKQTEDKPMDEHQKNQTTRKERGAPSFNADAERRLTYLYLYRKKRVPG